MNASNETMDSCHNMIHWLDDIHGKQMRGEKSWAKRLEPTTRMGWTGGKTKGTGASNQTDLMPMIASKEVMEYGR